MKYTTDIKVRGYHLDAYKHVNNAKYLEIFEEARWRLFDELENQQEFLQKYGFIIVNININYRSEALQNDILTIETSISKIGTKSMTYLQIAHNNRNNKVSADAEVTFVIMDMKTKEVCQINDEITKYFK